MIGPGLVVIGLAMGIVGWLLLRRHGTAWRVGRLLAAAPRHTLEEAFAMAGTGESRYVRVHGRIDSEEEFPSEDGQPLVYQRRRLQRRSGRAWQTFDDERLAVPFGLRHEGTRIVVDADALGDGLVVVPRESEGVAADLTEDALSGPLPDLPADTPVRLRIERISAVDHATVAGVPRRSAGEAVIMGPGQGRPLLLTTLEQDEAMRVLASEHRREVQLAAVLLVAAPVALVLGAIAMVAGL